MSAGCLISRGLGGPTLVTRGYGAVELIDRVVREVVRLVSRLATVVEMESKLWQK